MPLQHNSQQHFFKYTSYHVASLIVQHRRLRWSSPTLFNDPFDHQVGFVWDYSGEDLCRSLGSIMLDWVFGPSVPQHRPTSLSVMLNKLRAIRGRLDRGAIESQLMSGAVEMGRRFPQACALLNEQVIAFLTSARVLCLTEDHDNVVMWSHYAQQHTGAVFKLRRLEHLDHRFTIARKVSYTDEPMRYAGLEEYAASLAGFIELDIERIHDLAYRKHSDWAYEREWRIHRPLLDFNAPAGVSDELEPPELFEAMYIGCKATDEATRSLAELARQHLPKMEVFKARIAPGAASLSFEKIG